MTTAALFLPNWGVRRSRPVAHYLWPLAFFLCSGYAIASQTLVPAGQGRGALAIANDGRIGELVHEGGNRLLYRERLPGQQPDEWEEVCSEASSGGVPSDQAVLRFDSAGRATVICRVTGERPPSWSRTSWFVERVRTGRNTWENGRPLLQETLGSSNVTYIFDPQGSVYALHFLYWWPEAFTLECITEPYSTESLALPWKEGSASTSSEAGDYFPLDGSTGYVDDSPLGWEPRHVSAVIDRSGTLHIVYGKGYIQSRFPAGIEQRSWLLYVCRKAGESEFSEPVKLNTPEPAFGDGAVGVCIAAAPNGTVAIAAGFVPRSPRGSTRGAAKLRYFVKQPNQKWSMAVVAGSADDYQLRDGPRGTGIDPWLTFDSKSRPSIIFTDHASEHNPYCYSYRGQIRLATRLSATSGNWTLTRLLSRNGVSPRDFQTWSPTIASGGGKVVVAAVSSIRDRADDGVSLSHSYDFLERTVYPFETLPFAAIPPNSLPIKIGAVELGQTSRGYALRVNGELTAITKGKINANAKTISGWIPLGAAARPDRSYNLYWRKTPGDQYALWILGEAGNLAKSRNITRTELLGAELELQSDLDGNGKIGS